MLPFEFQGCSFLLLLDLDGAALVYTLLLVAEPVFILGKYHLLFSEGAEEKCACSYH